MLHKFRIFLFLFLISNATAFGQAVDSVVETIPSSKIQTNHAKFEIGLEGGINIIDIRARTYWDNEYISKREGIIAGLIFQANTKKNISFQTGIYFTSRNYNSEYVTRQFNFITVPLFLKCYTGKKHRFYLAGGTYIDIINGQKTKSNNSFYSNYDFNLSRNAYNGFAGGLGCDFLVHKDITLSVDAKYGSGRTKDIRKEPITINTVNFLLGVKYNFHERFPKETTSAMDKEKQKKDTAFKTKVKMKIFYAYQVTFRNKTNKESSFYESSLHQDSWTNMNYRTEIEIPSKGAEFGVLVEFQKSKHWNMDIGATFENQGFTTQESTFYIHHDSRVGPALSQHSVDTLKNEKLTYKYYFLTIPFIVNYQTKIKRASLYIGLGIEPKLLLNSNISFSKSGHSEFLNGDGYKYDNSEEKFYEKLSGTVFASGHIGADLPLGKKMFLFIEPDYKIALGHTSTIPQLWSAGCRVGLKF